VRIEGRPLGGDGRDSIGPECRQQVRQEIGRQASWDQVGHWTGLLAVLGFRERPQSGS